MDAPDYDLIFAARAALLADPLVAGLIGERFYDPPPQGDEAEMPYISLGPTFGIPEDAECIPGQEITFQLDIWSAGADQAHSSVECRKICRAVKNVLHNAELALTTNALVTLEMTLQRVFRDPDGITNHGVMQFTALVEERDPDHPDT
ncbi:DUF3168 domain-containing protein [Pelagibacterium limicola]|uniref:DUF3168 domain-containing protein n=1 Tax=Pelagibacterium limicola TaxID=2791022 RepID=UPI0018B0019F|nr:DUF3168 domain-containing protein [Pelagibacterium limicola]